jgi:hypothetical protein
MARTMEEATALPTRVAVHVPAPFLPAGLSRALTWIGELPAGGWWLFPCLVVLELVWSHGVLWAAGLLPVGTFDPVVGFGTLYAPYTLGALAYLNGVARGALRSFWPATGWPERDRAAWSYALTTSPTGFGPAVVVFGIVLAVGGFVAVPSSVLPGEGSSRLITFVAYFPTLAAGYALFLAATIHTTRQLRLVRRIHHEATAIDPFDRVPVYAFSRLTVQIGLAYVLVGYYALTVNGSWQFGNAVSWIPLAGTFGVGIAAFVVPLWGIHGRLVDAKEQLVRDAELRLDVLGREMYQHVDARDLDATKLIADSLGGVRGMRDRIDRLPTWPWPPQILRGFLSALFLPVIVYVISRLITSGFGQ